MFHTGQYNKIPLKKKSKTSSDELLPKIPRIEMPEDFKVRTQPLFSLPQEILKLPPLTKKSGRASRKPQKQTRTKSVMQSFTAMRKAREQFREKLVKLICQAGPGEESGAVPSGEEKNMLRYFYYIKYGIDTVHVAPLDNKILLRVMDLISPKLIKDEFRDTLMTCTNEIREEFQMSMKKAIVDFVLRDPNTEESIEEEETPLKLELAKKDDAWRNRYAVAKKYLQKNLHNINPCIAQVLTIWWKQFNDLRLISMKDIKSSDESYDLADFLFICKRHVDTAITVLNTQWIPAIQNIFFLVTLISAVE